MKDLSRRFKIEHETGCWMWEGYRNPAGYGITHDGAKTVRAHRLSWIISKGPIPNGLCVLHRCDIPACINPSHLFLGTKKDNMRDAIRKGRGPYFKVDSRCKLSVEKVRQLLELRKVGLSLRQLANNFGISKGLVSYVLYGRGWKLKLGARDARERSQRA